MSQASKVKCQRSNVDRPLSILMLNYEFPPLGGGAANATYYLLKKFSKRDDLKIDLVTSSVDKFRIEKFSENITIHFLDINKRGNLHYQSNKDLLAYSWKAYRYCKSLVRQQALPVSSLRGAHPDEKATKQSHAFDLVHAFFGIPCGYIAMKLGLPYIVSLRGSDVPFYNKRFYWLDRILFKRLSIKIWKKAKAVIANSQGLKELAQKTSRSQKIGIIHNGIDTEEFSPKTVIAPVSASGGRNEVTKQSHDAITIISTGRLIERKGYNYLIEALEGLNNCELVLIGNGDQKESLQELANKLGVNVKFCGGIKHDGIPSLLNNADVFILPSLNEGMSNSILEAMACGLPIIATDTGGSAELLQNNGFVVPKASSGALREAIIKYMNNPGLLREHGARSRKIAEEMSWGKAAEAYRNLY